MQKGGVAPMRSATKERRLGPMSTAQEETVSRDDDEPPLWPPPPDRQPPRVDLHPSTSQKVAVTTSGDSSASRSEPPKPKFLPSALELVFLPALAGAALGAFITVSFALGDSLASAPMGGMVGALAGPATGAVRLA